MNFERAYYQALARIEQLEAIVALQDSQTHLPGLGPQTAYVFRLLARPQAEYALCSTERLWVALWGDRDEPPDGNAALKVQIHKLRAWLRKHAPDVWIETRWGSGYCLRNKVRARALLEHGLSPKHGFEQHVLHAAL